MTGLSSQEWSDHFDLNPALEKAFFAMVQRNQQLFFASSTRYSTQAFLRRQLGRRFAPINTPIYQGFSAAREALDTEA